MLIHFAGIRIYVHKKPKTKQKTSTAKIIKIIVGWAVIKSTMRDEKTCRLVLK